MNDNRFSKIDTNTLLKYRDACEKALLFSYMNSIEKSLKLIQKELNSRKIAN